MLILKYHILFLAVCICLFLLINIFRLLAEEAERSMAEMQRRLNAREDDVLSANHKTSHLEEKVQEVQKVSNQNLNEINQLRSTISVMDREKDSLQMTIDDKTERLAVLNEEIMVKVSFWVIWLNVKYFDSKENFQFDQIIIMKHFF